MRDEKKNDKPNFIEKKNHFQKNEQKLQQKQREQRQTSGNKSMHSENEVQIDKMSYMDCGLTFIFNHIILLLCRDFYCFLKECELNFWLRFMDMKEDEINNGFLNGTSLSFLFFHFNIHCLYYYRYAIN